MVMTSRVPARAMASQTEDMDRQHLVHRHSGLIFVLVGGANTLTSQLLHDALLVPPLTLWPTVLQRKLMFR
jgi:hypothetical protein